MSTESMFFVFQGGFSMMFLLPANTQTGMQQLEKALVSTRKSMQLLRRLQESATRITLCVCSELCVDCPRQIGLQRMGVDQHSSLQTRERTLIETGEL